MTCSVISDAVTIVMNKGPHTGPNNRVTPGSALQNPELSRIRLAALLRRRTPSERPRRMMEAFWDSFMDRCHSTCANANTN